MPRHRSNKITWQDWAWGVLGLVLLVGGVLSLWLPGDSAPDLAPYDPENLYVPSGAPTAPAEPSLPEKPRVPNPAGEWYCHDAGYCSRPKSVEVINEVETAGK
jgi:hypothetical protein